MTHPDLKTLLENSIRATLTCAILLAVLQGCSSGGGKQEIPDGLELFPANGASNVNPDTKLALTFPGPPVLANHGTIRVYDARTDSLVDLLDMSVPPGPKNSRTPAPYNGFVYETEQSFLEEHTGPDGKVIVPVPQEDIYQHTYIGGMLESDIYHFYPVVVHGNKASICLHHNALEYGRSYYVELDPGVLSFPDSMGLEISGKRSWRFKTRPAPPAQDRDTLVVSADGTGDFNTVLGAIQHIPDRNPEMKTIIIRSGRYEEIVYFRNKENIAIIGEDRDSVLICYANNGFFNPRPTGPRDEMIRRFRNRRAVFAADHCNDIRLSGFAVQSLGERPAQAEGLLVIGERIVVDQLDIVGSGDALQATGLIYINRTSIKGFGDNVLGYGAVFFNDCDLVSTYGPHLWVRNDSATHGNVFLNCTFSKEGDVETVIARAPSSQHYSFPYVEAVLINCFLEGIRPEGWGRVAENREHIRYWEYNSRNLSDGTPADVSRRAPYSRQLSMERDSGLIANYSRPSFVLEGWDPLENQ